MDTIFSVLQFAGILLLVLVIFNIIIIVHELGHYWAARWRGLQVDKFQIWFGKPIWKKTINGVQWGLGTIPAGGFVALPQMAPMEMLEGTVDGEGRQRKLEPIKPLDKIIVAFAGPLFSFGLAVVFAVLVWGIGYPVSAGDDTTTIGYIAEGSPAAEAGLQVGDEIISVAGAKVKSFHGMVDSVTWSVVSSEGDSIDFNVIRDGQEMAVAVSPRVMEDQSEKKWYQRWFTRPPLRKAGIGPWEKEIRVADVMENSPAAQAGIKEGDLLRKLNGQILPSSFTLEQIAQQGLGQPLELTVESAEGELRNVTVVPRVPEKKGSMPLPVTVVGIPAYGSDDPVRDGLTRTAHPAPPELIGQTFRIMYNTITKVASPGSDISLKHLSGPVGIINLYYRLFQNPEGWKLVLWFSVILNINLAIMNMMPFPVLDGGHITMAVFESIFRRPIDIRIQNALTSTFAIILISFMLFVTVFDSGDVLRQNEKYVPWEYLPQDAAGV